MNLKYVESDELYPYYYFADVYTKRDEDYLVDIPHHIVLEINAAETEFFKWQEYLAEKCNEGRKQARLKASENGVPSKGF